ncbi:hypothetical protein GCM10008090_12660 [Arenicella chitinivorans]|uniref:DUF2157 domain-containing protein n=1 Tax=Arenicella chitinivorans TaxID=1329800 RepID=A0A918VKD0_9GAMM|nr:DUF2157 domain-containing protein [Arenicella chitinivorans]GHA04703.1 hypothetical protein GCM10008090_12660 [Arenicella chitinivorans]
MDISKQTLTAAVAERILSSEQADALYAFLRSRSEHKPAFTFTHVLYYLGGLIAIGAMTLFMNLGWEAFGGAGIVSISLLYGAVGIQLVNSFSRKSLIIPAGICATFVVSLTPLAIYGLQQWLGVWPDETVYRDYHRYVKWHWLYMELGTLAVGLILARKYQYPFMVMPIAITLWYMSMDLSVIITGEYQTWEIRKLVSMVSGVLLIALAIWVDIRAHRKADYAFWLYIVGVLAFWGGLSLQHSDSELAKFGYFCINLGLIGVGVVLVRKVFVVCGALGCCFYLGYLASDVFKDSWLFPVALSVIGLGVIYLGVVWQKNEEAITRAAHSILPEPLRRLLESKSLN